MKKFFIIIFLWPLSVFSQSPDTCFTSDEIIDISNTLDSLYYIDSVNNEIISKQENLILELENYIILDSLEIKYRNNQVKLLNETIDLYIEREKQFKPKWYDHKIIWFGFGITTTLLTGKLIVEVVQ